MRRSHLRTLLSKAFVFRTLLVVAALVITLAALPRAAAAQDRPLVRATYAAAPAGLDEVVALFKRPDAPARLYRLEAPDSVRVGDDVRVGALVNVAVAALPLRVTWDFGDGTTARSLHAVHRYAAPGTYTVTCTVANDGGSVSDTLTVTVHPLPSPAAAARDEM